MKHIGIIYFIVAAAILAYGIMMLVNGQGKLWADICITLIGVYYLYRGIATTHNARVRKEREREDQGNDPANA